MLLTGSGHSSTEKTAPGCHKLFDPRDVWDIALARSGESLARECDAGTYACFFSSFNPNEPRMPEVLVRRPLHKLKLPHEHRLSPAAVLHLRRRQPFAPPPRPHLRQIRERTLGSLQTRQRCCNRSRSAGGNPLVVRADINQQGRAVVLEGLPWYSLSNDFREPVAAVAVCVLLRW